MTPPTRVSLIESRQYTNPDGASDSQQNNVWDDRGIGDMSQKGREAAAPWYFLVPSLVDVQAGDAPRT
jgi:hypothetical protein